LHSTQDNFSEILEIIPKQYIIINDSLQIIVDKEKELVNTISNFQELMMWNQSLNVPRIAQFTNFEQLKGEMVIKTWENNLEESKRLAREAKGTSLNYLLVVYVEIDDIDLIDVHSMIGSINVNDKREDFKKRREKDKVEIQQMNQVNLQILNHFLVKNNLHSIQGSKEISFICEQINKR
jgi:hypothetical protein